MPAGYAAAAAAVVGGVTQHQSSKDALASQEDQLADNQAFIKQQADLSREDVLPLFDAAQQNRQQGFQGALDVFGQTIPQQADVFQQGNVGAQQALLSGQQQAQNAILGLPTDMSGFQPQALQYNTDFAQQQLPQFEGGAGALLAGDVDAANLADQNADYSHETIQAILGSGRFPSLTNKVTRALGDVGQITPGQWQQFMADRPRLGSFFKGEAMNIARREGLLPQDPQQAQNPLAGSFNNRRNR